MKNTILYVLLSIPFVGSTQLEISKVSECIVDFQPGEIYRVEYDVQNISEDTLYFNWKISVPEWYESNFDISTADQNIEYLPGIYTNCDFDLPNILIPDQVSLFYVFFYANDDLDVDDITVSPFITIELVAYPDCEELLLTEEVIIDLSSATIEQSDVSDITIAPNPAMDVLQVYGNSEYTDYSIYSLGASNSHTKTPFSAAIDISNLIPGYYILRLENADSVRAIPFIKQNQD